MMRVLVQDVIVEMTDDDGVGGVDYSFECIGNVQVQPDTLTQAVSEYFGFVSVSLKWPKLT